MKKEKQAAINLINIMSPADLSILHGALSLDNECRVSTVKDSQNHKLWSLLSKLGLMVELEERFDLQASPVDGKEKLYTINRLGKKSLPLLLKVASNQKARENYIISNLAKDYLLGQVLFNTSSGDEDLKKAKSHFQVGAEKNDCGCQIILGAMYEKGVVCDVDFDVARKWYEKAANQNIPDAYFSADAKVRLALLYKNGYGVQQDLEKALQLLKEASEENHLRAKYEVGKFFNEGLGTKVNNDEAMKHYYSAALKGYPYAQLKLAFMWFENAENSKDFISTYIMASLANNYGMKGAKEIAQKVRSHIPKDEIEKIEERIVEIELSYPDSEIEANE